MAPRLFIVPGLYEGPLAFEPLVQALRKAGYSRIHTTRLVSTGCDAGKKPQPTMDDDTAAIAKDLADVVEEAGSDDVVALLHSAGGFLGSGAMKGLTARARKADGVAGGVTKIIFMAAGILPEGAVHRPLPFFEYDDEAGTQRCRDPLNNCLHDVAPEEAKYWLAKLQHQPGRGWDKSAKFCGWKEVPSVFIVAEKDRLLPASLQEQMAGLAGSNIVRVDAGHFLQLSKTDEVARIVGDVLGGKVPHL